MTVRPRNIDFAARFGVKKQQVQTWVNQGMPVDSYEAAEAWIGSRVKGNTLEITDEFDKVVHNQRRVMELAHQKYLEDRDSNPEEAPTSYSTYDKALKTLMTLEREQVKREIESKEYIRLQTAIDRFGKVFAQVREEFSQLPAQMAARCNPDNPGRAMKLLENDVNSRLSRLSAAKDGAVSASGDDMVDAIEVEQSQDTPDEVQEGPTAGE